MGYFANGTEGEQYREEYCENCKNNTEDCVVWVAHLIANYAECSNKESVLHVLIPRNDKGSNLPCRMFKNKQQAAINMHREGYKEGK